MKQRILATNAARVYGIDLDTASIRRDGAEWLADARADLAALAAGG